MGCTGNENRDFKKDCQGDTFWIFFKILKGTSKDLNYFTFLLFGELCFSAREDWAMRGSRFIEVTFIAGVLNAGFMGRL